MIKFLSPSLEFFQTFINPCSTFMSVFFHNLQILRSFTCSKIIFIFYVYFHDLCLFQCSMLIVHWQLLCPFMFLHMNLSCSVFISVLYVFVSKFCVHLHVICFLGSTFAYMLHSHLHVFILSSMFLIHICFHSCLCIFHRHGAAIK